MSPFLKVVVQLHCMAQGVQTGLSLLPQKRAPVKKDLKLKWRTQLHSANPLILPDYQNEYGQGGYEEFWYKNGLNAGRNDGVDESFGPRLDYVIKPEDIVPGGKMYWAVEAGSLKLQDRSSCFLSLTARLILKPDKEFRHHGFHIRIT